MEKVVLPIDFIEGIASEVSGLAVALDSVSPVSVRLNPMKLYGGEQELSDRVAWCEWGRYLPERPQFTLDPLHWAGGYYVQEASSMVVGSVVGDILGQRNGGVRVVDLCAAPGGKATHLGSVVGQRGGVLIANEVIRQRAGVLVQNVVRWGEGNTVVTSSEAGVLAAALSGSVDVVVVDAPCSGEGMFRKDMVARKEWSKANVELCAGRARRIIADMVPMLKTGGYLVFSTCTFNRVENEQTVEWLLEGGEWELAEDYLGDWGSGNGVGRHFYPSEVRGEGFYIAVLRYVGGRDFGGIRKSKNSGRGVKDSIYSVRPIVEVNYAGKLWGYSDGMIEVVESLQRGRVQILYSGVEFGELIRGVLKPSHSLALYAYANGDLYPTVELELEAAQEYLRKGVLDVSLLVDGLQVVCYKGLSLGFIKRIGNRANNLYPTSWRIVNL